MIQYKPHFVIIIIINVIYVAQIRIDAANYHVDCYRHCAYVV